MAFFDFLFDDYNVKKNPAYGAAVDPETYEGRGLVSAYGDPVTQQQVAKYGTEDLVQRPSLWSRIVQPNTSAYANKLNMANSMQPIEMQRDMEKARQLSTMGHEMGLRYGPLEAQQRFEQETKEQPVRKGWALQQAKDLANLAEELRRKNLPQHILDRVEEAKRMLDFRTEKEIPQTELAQAKAEADAQPFRTKTELKHKQELYEAERKRHESDMEIMRPDLTQEDQHLPASVLAVKYPSAKMSDIMGEVSAMERIKAGVPKKSAEAEREQYISMGRKALAANRLGTPEALANQENFEANTGVPLGSAASAYGLPRIQDGKLFVDPNTQRIDPYAVDIQSKMALANSMAGSKSPLAAGVEAAGFKKINPGQPFGAEVGRKPLGFVPSAPVPTVATPLVEPTQPTTSERAPLIYGPQRPATTAFGGIPITEMDFWNNLTRKVIRTITPKGSAFNP